MESSSGTNNARNKSSKGKFLCTLFQWLETLPYFAYFDRCDLLMTNLWRVTRELWSTQFFRFVKVFDIKSAQGLKRKLIFKDSDYDVTPSTLERNK